MKRIIFIALFVLCGCGGDAHPASYNPSTMVTMADYGSNAAALDNAITAANAAGKDVYFPSGTYSVSLSPSVDAIDTGSARFIGFSRDTTEIVSDNTSKSLYLNGAQDISISGFKIGGSAETSPHVFSRITVNHSRPSPSAAYVFYTGYPYNSGDYTIEHSTFNTDNVYSVVWLYRPGNVLIDNSTFNSNSGEPQSQIRIQEPIPSKTLSVTNSTVTGISTTGIFIGSDRFNPIIGAAIENDTFSGQTEESISLDGFGNNPFDVPVIAQGIIDNVSNDGSGRLVISMDNAVYHDGTDGQECCVVPSPVSLRNDWTNFYFTLGQGSGQEGIYVKVYSYDNEANTITADTLISADNVTVGGDFGIQSGIFNSVIRGNNVSNITGSAVAISAYLNVFGTLAENNTISNASRGIILYGGLMLSTYEALAWNNNVVNNTFTNVGAPVDFNSIYGGRLQYGNQFINNTIIGGGTVTFNQQDNLTVYGNRYTGNDNLVYFKVAGACTRFAKGTPTLNGVVIPQAICVAENDGGGNGIWSAMADAVVKAALAEDTNYRGIGLNGVNAISVEDKNIIATGAQHTFMGWNATTGALQ